MSLAEYQPEARVVPFKGGSFTVKGLSLMDITTLIRHHLPDIEALFDIGISTLEGRTDLTQEDLTRIAIAVAEQAPGFVSNLIGLAAGETSEKAIAAAASLPFPTQIKALVEIADITFAEVGGVKNAVESVAGLLKKNQISMPVKMSHQ